MLLDELFTSFWKLFPFLASAIQCSANLLTFTLGFSIWIGEKIVYYIFASLSNLYYLLSSLLHGISVMCEDFIIFVKDIQAIITFLQNAVEVLLTLVINTLYFIVYMSLMLVNVIFDIIEGQIGVLTNFFELFANLMHIFKESLILIGLSIWLCIKIIPLCVIYLIRLSLSHISRGAGEVRSIVYCFLEMIVSISKRLLHFIVDTPAEAVFGLTVGLVALYGIHKNWYLILNASVGYFRHACAAVQSFQLKLITVMMNALVCSAIKVKYMTNSFKQIIKSKETDYRPIEDLAEQESKLCVICKDKERDVIILPCRHMCLCSTCSWEMRKKYSHSGCPVCRERIHDHMKVYT